MGDAKIHKHKSKAEMKRLQKALDLSNAEIDDQKASAEQIEQAENFGLVLLNLPMTCGTSEIFLVRPEKIQCVEPYFDDNRCLYGCVVHLSSDVDLYEGGAVPFWDTASEVLSRITGAVRRGSGQAIPF